VEHVTADVVSVNAVNRTLVVSITGGPPQTVELDEAVAGLADLKAGDRAILTLRKEPGRARVTSLIRATGPKVDGGSAIANGNPIPLPGPAMDADAPAWCLPSGRRPAEDANRVDRTWRPFVTLWGQVAASYEGAGSGSASGTTRPGRTSRAEPVEISSIKS
jgi:hypothetical protein